MIIKAAFLAYLLVNARPLKMVSTAQFELTWFMICFFFLLSEMATEKAVETVLKGIEDFDPSVLKHTETQEKVVLPDAEGKRSLAVYPKRHLFKVGVYSTDRFLMARLFVFGNIFYHRLCSVHELKASEFKSFIYLSCICLFWFPAVQQEKTQQNLLHGVESFDKSALKPTDTVEKIILPATEGKNYTILFEIWVPLFPVIILYCVPIVAPLLFIPTFPFQTDIAQEKGQQQLREGIETFDPANLKHAETQEKNPLPTKEGTST